MYKHYALIKNGIVLDYPVDPRKYISEKNAFNIHEYWDGGELDGNIYVFCHNREPEYGFDETLVETTPEFDLKKGMWFRKYNVVKLDAKIFSMRRDAAYKSANEILIYLRQELSDMQQVIINLSENKRNKWAEYAIQIESIPSQPNYPFQYDVPQRPDKVQDLNIKVARV